MDVWTQRHENEKFVENKLKREIPGYIFSAGDLYAFSDGKKDEPFIKDEVKHNRMLEEFETILSFGEEGKIYLWNEMIWCDRSRLDFCSYSCVGQEFLENMFNHKEEMLKKYPHYFEDRGFKNINEPIDTDRLLLKPFNSELLEEYINFFKNNKKDYEAFARGDLDEEGEFAESYLSVTMKKKLTFAIIFKETKQLIGSIILELNRSSCVYNLAYHIKPGYRRIGLGYEAVNKIIQLVKKQKLLVLEETIRKYVYTLIHPNIKYIEASIDVNNIPSLSLIKKLGFEYMGLEKYSAEVNNKYIDSAIYDLVIDN